MAISMGVHCHESTPSLSKAKMVTLFLHGTGAAGVYDIAMHYQYEDGRGVAELSTMKRAMQGFHGFASQSPAVILNKAVGRDPQREADLSTDVPSDKINAQPEHQKQPVSSEGGQPEATAGNRSGTCMPVVYRRM